MTDLQTRRATLLAYLKSSVDAEDWHACRDCAADLEVLDARMEERAHRFADAVAPLPFDAKPNLAREAIKCLIDGMACRRGCDHRSQCLANRAEQA